MAWESRGEVEDEGKAGGRAAAVGKGREGSTRPERTQVECTRGSIPGKGCSKRRSRSAVPCSTGCKR